MHKTTSESKDQKQNIPFNSLSPVSDPEKHKYYCDSLEWALFNCDEKDIKNIALTGTYGSGKSSILKTFQETTSNESLKFLNISLATFKEEVEEGETTSHEEGEITETTPNENKKIIDFKKDQLRLIELSILQQIFYHEEYDKIPDSRFKKIRSLKPNEVNETTWILFGVIITLYTFFNFHFLRTLLNLPEPEPWFAYIFQGILATGGLILCFYLLRSIVGFSQKLTISKLNFQNLEIQVADKIDKSILNNHLDEILYFFEVTDYNVVIIEDLDRFEQTEIFTKLREINLLINNSKSIDRTVTFIYAIRDEMFKDKDRTKFFDFIVPVIPVINYSNSNEQLARALERFDYSLSFELIDEVAFYVDDMRLLYNIVNEFHIYFQKFKGEKYQDKLFAIIVYKNIYPEDFVMLGKNKGVLYKNLITNKLVWANDAMQQVDDENSLLKIKLDTLENALPKNLEELRRIYLMEYLKKANNLSYFRIADVNYSVEKMLEDENFEKLKGGSINYRDNQYTREFSFKFSDVESQIDPEKSYLERKTEIESKNSGRIKDIQDKIRKNEEEKRRIKTAKIHYLLRDKKITLSSKPSKQEQLIVLLIRKGYIAEDYLNYISYFYPGSITEKDHWFLMNVRNEWDGEFDYKLDEVDNVIKKISESEFEKSYILNYSLLDYLLESQKLSIKKDILFRQLGNESESSLKFISSYIREGKNIELFVKKLCASWKNIWRYIEHNSSFSEEMKLNYLTLILKNSEMEDLERIASVSKLESIINNQSDFLSIIKDSDRLIEIIDVFDLKFTALKLEGSSKKVKEYIYLMNNYAINPYMLRTILKEFSDFQEEEFNQSNYAAIQLSGCEKLIEYVDKHSDEYVNSVYLKLKNNKYEKHDFLVKLLNHPEIPKNSKEKIIIQTETIVNSLSDLKHPKELSDFLIENLKIKTTWENVIFDFKEKNNSFSPALTEFLNSTQNVEILSSQKLLSKEEGHSIFRKAFLINNKIKDEFFVRYLNSFPFVYEELAIGNLSKLKVQGLIEQNKFSFNLSNYNSVKSEFPPLHISFIILNISDFFKLYSELFFSETELSQLVSNPKLVDSHKIKIIENFEAENTIVDIETLNLIGKIALKHKQIDLSYSSKSSLLLKSSLLPKEKIEFYLNNRSSFKEDFIKDLLNSLGGGFKQLNEKGPMPYFKKSDLMIQFFDYLKQEGKISKTKEKKDQIQVTTFRK